MDCIETGFTEYTDYEKEINKRIKRLEKKNNSKCIGIKYYVYSKNLKKELTKEEFCKTYLKSNVYKIVFCFNEIP